MRRLLWVLAGGAGFLMTIMLPVNASAVTVNFAYTGAPQTWTVPYGVTSATFNLYGAQGHGFGPGSAARGGEGGWAKKTFSVTPNTQIIVRVGGEGGTWTGGFNGGGYGARGGGGATDIRIGGDSLADRVLIAGGGGGGGFSCLAGGVTAIAVGGYGGGLTGGSGNNTGCSPSGTGGTQSAGGSPGGTLGQGGSGGPSGGGGGYYGGGGAIEGYSNGGPGGGGSSYGPPGFATSSGVQEGNGRASVDYEVTETRDLYTSAVGPGDGYLTSSPAGIDCGITGDERGHTVCQFTYGKDQPVTVTANPSPGSQFDQWIFGPCMGSTQPTCTATLNQTSGTGKIVSGQFKNGPRQLSVTKSGNGSGSVSSNPAGIDCGTACSSANADFTYGTSVTLTATPATGSDFTGWTGACSGTSTCTAAMDEIRNVEATFTLQKRILTLAKFESGSGTVTSSPAGIDFPTGASPCGLNGSCVSAQFDYGTIVTLTPTASIGSDFTDWGGNDACQSFGPDQLCTLTMDQDRYAEVEFELQKKTLTATKSGNGTGTVASTPAGIDCGADCSNDYDYGTQISLTATPGAHSVFTGWDGPCSGTSTCDVTMEQEQEVTANFTLEKRTLDVAKSGNGSGTVSSQPAGIDCGNACDGIDFDFGTQVTLTADPATGSDFTGWTEACSGTSTCTVTMDQARSVDATFTLEERSLEVDRSGNGSGTVTSDVGGLDCGSVCAANLDFGTAVTLTAASASSSDFGGWTGACSGPSITCTVSMDEARTVTADFNLKKFPITITTSGTGTGTVTSSPSGASFDFGTSVTLTASPASGSTFATWGGSCSGTSSTCTLTMDQARSVDAGFATVPLDPAPVISRLRVAPRKVHVAGRKKSALGRKGPAIKISLSEAASVQFSFARAKRKKAKSAYLHQVELRTSSIRIPVKIRKKLRPGRYRLTAVATDSSGQRSAAKRATFRVIR